MITNKQTNKNQAVKECRKPFTSPSDVGRSASSCVQSVTQFLMVSLVFGNNAENTRGPSMYSLWELYMEHVVTFVDVSVHHHRGLAWLNNWNYIINSCLKTKYGNDMRTGSDLTIVALFPSSAETGKTQKKAGNAAWPASDPLYGNSGRRFHIYYT